jgi:hypothetical protein
MMRYAGARSGMENLSAHEVSSRAECIFWSFTPHPETGSCSLFQGEGFETGSCSLFQGFHIFKAQTL